MKRLPTSRRVLEAETIVSRLERNLLCKHGAWNARKILHEIEKLVHKHRMAAQTPPYNGHDQGDIGRHVGSWVRLEKRMVTR